ncbi:MAG: sigma-54 dependent transcriptional regulator [Geobacteraceae bacterium]|nr:sigma-54 dependent transcriptional regulator [Geobacteraceae bacterium]
MKPKILILDDDIAILEMFKSIFAAQETELLLEKDGDSALRRIRMDRPNVAVVDINLPQISGLEVLREAKKLDPGLSVIITTGHSSTQFAIEAMKFGAYDYLTKPFDIKRLRNAIQKALECNLLNRKVRYTRDREQLLDENGDTDIMIGSSPEMIEIWKMVGKVADSDATVLIQGDSGTGKELLARAIYNNSRRKNRPFLPVNCAALPENLLESELFGHEKGAFTDAHTRRIGKFEQCNGGTIFLDEIGEMSLANQGKLLRVLEGQEFERVGGNETIKVDVRVVTATNRSLVNAVKDKRFRMDLFYRLRIISFYLPPLSERQEDIPLLVDLFVRQFSRKYGKPIKGVAPETLDLLLAHPWEGNIRELKNAISSSIVLCKGDYIMPEDLESIIGTGNQFGEIAEVNLQRSGDDYNAVFTQILQPVFDKICLRHKGEIYDHVTMGLEKALIAMALQKNENNQVLAAKILGISRNTLRDRVERFKIG